MIKIIICLRDQTMTDIVKTAFKQFPSMTAYPVERGLAPEITAEGDYHAVVVDLENDGDQERTWIAQLRQDCPKVEILALVDQRFKDRLNRLKVELGVFSFVPLPLDPFDLARRIVRLEQHLIERHPMMK